VNAHDLIKAPLTHDGQNVITLALVDQLHGLKSGVAGRAFRRLRSRGKMDLGRHYHVVSRGDFPADDLTAGGIAGFTTPGDVNVLTERGYLTLVKALDDDVSWEVQSQLVDGYFRGRDLDLELVPKSDIAAVEMLSRVVTEAVDQGFRRVDDDLKDIKAKVKELGDTVSRITKKMPFKAAVVREHLRTIVHMGGMCPCCHHVPILNKHGDKLRGKCERGFFMCVEEHFQQPHLRGVKDTWLACGWCNEQLKDGSFHDGHLNDFRAYQSLRRRLNRERPRPLGLFDEGNDDD